jgi:hypothetical protein
MQNTLSTMPVAPVIKTRIPNFYKLKGDKEVN